MFGEDTLLHKYTRQDALRDGVLIDVSTTAREAGITYPTATTAAVFQQYVRVPEGVESQDETGRLWDILTMLRHAITRGPEGDMLLFTVFVSNANEKPPSPVKLKAVCHPGDEGEPVITVLLPEED